MGYAALNPNNIIEISSAIAGGHQIVTTIAGDLTLTDIVVPSDIRGTIYHAYVDVIFSTVINSAAVLNQLDGDQYIQIAVNADFAHPHNVILLPNHSLRCPASTNMVYGRIYGNIDIQGLFKPGDTLNVFWNNSLCEADTLGVYDCQTILRMVVG